LIMSNVSIFEISSFYNMGIEKSSAATTI